MSTILVVDDEEMIRQEIGEALAEQGYRVLKAEDGLSALAELKMNQVQLVITDLRMPRAGGLEVIQKGKEISPETQFVVMTAFGSMETAIEAMRAGAIDYLIKPVAMEELLLKVGRVMETVKLRATNKMLRRDLDRKVGTLDMVGSSPALEKIRQMVRKVAPARSPVLITGESGTGKELIARAIHALSAAKSEPFVAVNCAAIPETLLESELFGHQKGAFTGAVADAEGLFRAARKGTLFLDEIGELPQPLQAKLLRVLEDKMVQPVGSSKQIPLEARIIAATNRNLSQEIEKNNFREDLFYRLAVVELYSPPLRERRDDIPLLVNHLMRRFNAELGRSYTGVDEGCMKVLVQAPWKGNIRELQNAIERAMLLGNEPLLKESDIVTSSRSPSAPISNERALKDAVRNFELAHVQRILNSCDGNKRKAAEELGISLSSLYRYLGAEAPADERVNGGKD